MKINNKIEDFAVDKLNSLNLPHSILIIPDGNGRWAKSKNLNISEGHKTGGITLTKVLEKFLKVNVKVLGIWGFSEDNWKRDPQEIKEIMDVIKNTAVNTLDIMEENNVKFIVLGKTEKLEKEFPQTYKTLMETEEKTKENNGKTLALFIDYGERFQLESFANEREKDKQTSTYDLLSKINKGLPLFDMVFRTSGELRTSGFGPLISVSEYVFTEKNLPDLTETDLAKALIEYSGRQRRFGGRLQSK